MPKIVRFHETGGAEVLKLEDLPLVELGEGEVGVKVEAIGLNRADVMFRQGQYLVRDGATRFREADEIYLPAVNANAIRRYLYHTHI